MLFLQLSHKESEIGVGEWLIGEGEVPPFGGDRLEAVTHHGRTENHSIVELLGSDATPGGTLAVVASIFASFGISAKVGMALWTEPVECSSHVEFPLRRHIKESQVDS